MLGTPFSDFRLDSPLGKGLAVRGRIVFAIGLNQVRIAHRAAALAGDGSHTVNQGQQLGDVMGVGARQNYVQRNALRIREEVVLAARTTAIGWVRSGFFPAPTARIDELSAIARPKSRRSAPRSFAGKI